MGGRFEDSVAVTGHWLDRVYLRTGRAPKLFQSGWGDLDLFETVRVLARSVLPTHTIEVSWEPRSSSGLRVRRGTFLSPAAHLLPRSAKRAVMWEVSPPGAVKAGPTCILFAATGDEGPGSRLTPARWLARRGVTSVILENPFYGVRRPEEQEGTALRYASDQCAMVASTILEGRALAHHLSEGGKHHIGVAGMSMGGLVAADVAALSSIPMAVASFLAPSSGAAVYLHGPLTSRIDWARLDAEAGGRAATRARFARLVLEPGDVTALPPIARPDLAILGAARADAIVPPAATLAIHQHWRGSELRWVHGGHVSSFLLARRAFARAMLDGLNRLGTAATKPPVSPPEGAPPGP